MNGSAPDAVIKAVNADFTAAHPGTTVKVEIQQWDGIQEKTTTALAGNNPPDVLEIGNTLVSKFAESGGLADLTDKKSDLGGDSWLQGLTDAGTLDGKLYGVPYYAGDRAVIYRKDLFAKAGITSPPTDRASFVAAADKLQRTFGSDPKFSALYFPGQYWYAALPFVWDEGGDIAVKDGEPWKGTLDSAESQAGLSWLKDVVQKYSKAPVNGNENDNDPAVPLGEGKAAMIIDPGWKVGVVTKNEPALKNQIAVFPIPGKSADRTAPVFLGGSNLAVSEGSDAPRPGVRVGEAAGRGEGADPARHRRRRDPEHDLAARPARQGPDPVGLRHGGEELQVHPGHAEVGERGEQHDPAGHAGRHLQRQEDGRGRHSRRQRGDHQDAERVGPSEPLPGRPPAGRGAPTGRRAGRSASGTGSHPTGPGPGAALEGTDPTGPADPTGSPHDGARDGAPDRAGGARDGALDRAGRARDGASNRAGGARDGAPDRAGRARDGAPGGGARDGAPVPGAPGGGIGVVAADLAATVPPTGAAGGGPVPPVAATAPMPGAAPVRPRRRRRSAGALPYTLVLPSIAAAGRAARVPAGGPGPGLVPEARPAPAGPPGDRLGRPGQLPVDPDRPRVLVGHRPDAGLRRGLRRRSPSPPAPWSRCCMRRLGRPMRLLVSAGLLLAWATPPVSAATVFRWLFDEQYGVVNWAAHRADPAGLEPALMVRRGSCPAFTVIVLCVVWQAIPFVALTLYAGLTTIPEDIFEAARIDGANAWRTFWSVTAPMLKPLFLILTSLSVIWDLKVFTQVYVITRGGPGPADRADQPLHLQPGFGASRFGLASAAAVIMVLLTLSVTVWYVRTMVRVGEEDM